MGHLSKRWCRAGLFPETVRLPAGETLAVQAYGVPQTGILDFRRTGGLFKVRASLGWLLHHSGQLCAFWHGFCATSASSFNRNKPLSRCLAF
jgi:hypothetical protein